MVYRANFPNLKGPRPLPKIAKKSLDGDDDVNDDDGDDDVNDDDDDACDDK